MTDTAAVSAELQEPSVEQDVLGALLTDPDRSFPRVRQLLPTAAMFSVAAHREIYGAMLRLVDRGAALEPVALRLELEAHKLLDAIGGWQYLVELLDYGSWVYSEARAKVVRDRWLRRDFRAAAEKAVRLAGELTIPIDDAVAETVSNFVAAGGLTLTEQFTPVRALLFDTMEAVEERQARGGQLVGAPTGLAELDQLTGGMRPGNLVVVAARPSVGKTALALYTAAAVADTDPDGDVLFVSLEMSKSELTERLLATAGAIPLDRIVKGTLFDADFPALSTAAGAIAKWPILFDVDLNSPARIRLALQHHMAVSKRRISLVVIDYLQLMSSDEVAAGDGNRTRELGSITRALKRQVARELNLPVLLLSQLSRANVRDKVRPPELSDLRDSGEIEQDADVVVMLHWDWKDPERHPDYPIWGNRDRTEVYLRKQRNGPTGDFNAKYLRTTGAWSSYAKDQR